MNRRQFICKTGKSAFAGVTALLLGDASPLMAETAKKSQLNIIIIKTDQLRWDFLGCMGHKVIKTPNIDRLAKESFVLENEFTVSTICVPSRTSFFTGKYVHRTAKTSNKMDEHIKVSDWSFIKPLKEMGYAIGLAGKNHTFHDEYFKEYFDYREETSHWGKTHGKITDDDKKVRAYLRNDPRPGFQNKVMLSGLIPGPMPFPEEKCPAYRIAEDGINFLEF
ncbi:MAG: sulfatase family protein [Planctomycetota bacterium]|jgi:arylsulfatase A-like enzyme